MDRLLRGPPHRPNRGRSSARRPGTAASPPRCAGWLTRPRRSTPGCLGDPDEILTMFDKRACHARLLGRGRRSAGSAGPGQLRRTPRQHAGGRLERGVRQTGPRLVGVRGDRPAGCRRPRPRDHLHRAGTAEALQQASRVRDYTAESDVAYLVDALAGDGLHVERWFAKAAWAGRSSTCRWSSSPVGPVTSSCAAAPGPMTNLHPGSRRGDLAALRAVAGPGYDAALDTCAAVAACFPGCPQVGVDLMFSPDWRRHAVAEVNALRRPAAGPARRRPRHLRRPDRRAQPGGAHSVTRRR